MTLAQRLWRQARFLCGGMSAVLLLTAPVTWLVSDGMALLAWAKVGFAVVLGGVYFLGGSPRLTFRRFTEHALAWATLLALAVALIAANVVAHVTGLEVDLTRERIHTLAPETTALLAGLDQGVRIIAFYAPSEKVAPEAAALLRLYARASARIHSELVDPDKRPDLVATYGIRRVGPRVAVATAKNHLNVAPNEAELSQAVLKLTRAPSVPIRFAVGHQERSLATSEPETLSAVVSMLTTQGYEVAAWDGNAALQVIVIAAPRSPLSDTEMQAVSDTLARGGGVLLLLEPNATDFREFLAQWHIEARADPIGDDAHRSVLGWASPYVHPAGPHLITDPIATPMLFHTARSLRIMDNGRPDAELFPLVQTSRTAWSESDPANPKPDANETRGPLLAGVAAEAVNGRLVVFGDVDWASNRLIHEQGNADLFLRSVGWAAGALTRSVRGHQRAASDLALAPQSLSTVRFVAMDLVPMLIVALGLGIVLHRRSL